MTGCEDFIKFKTAVFYCGTYFLWERLYFCLCETLSQALSIMSSDDVISSFITQSTGEVISY